MTQQGNGTKCQNPTFATFCPIACKKCADCDADEVAIEQQHGKLRKKVRIVGIVGDAGGKELEVIPCSNTCDEAIKRCSDHPECNIVEMAHSRVNHLRDGVHGVVISDNFTTKPLAVLRARWARWGPRLCHSGQQIEDLPRVRRVIKVIEYCASLAAQGADERMLRLALPCHLTI